jgi:hypothetical protein
MLVMPDREARNTLFDSIDVNGNGALSLAEIDKAVVSGFLGKAMHCPDFDHKPALMRAYHAADASHDGFIERSEFMKLLKYLVYFNNLWHKFGTPRKTVFWEFNAILLYTKNRANLPRQARDKRRKRSWTEN